jgi:16S rRNA (adenine1518-N6/adenine1519-N6)-dimethyltransferase
MKRRRLGQHYLVDGGVVESMVRHAQIEKGDRVLEIGTGRGVLTGKLTGLGKSLEAYEVDEQNYEATKASLSGVRVSLHLGDGFEARSKFDVLVSSLPYSESATFVKWLARSSYKRAVVVLQEDFVDKITTPPGSRDYRAISAISQISSEARVIEKVGRQAFSPPPKVNSVVVMFLPKRRIREQEVANVQRLFSLRRRKVDSALSELEMGSPGTFGDRRVYSLTPDEVHGICGN